MPGPLSSSAAPLSPGVGRAPVRPTPGQRYALVSQGEGLAGAGCTECGWQGKPTTPNRAAYALRIHSCALHRERQARKARGEAMRAGVDRTPKVLTGNRQHGTHVAYRLDRCRCNPCREATAAYDRQRTRQTAYGRWQPYVDAEPVRVHVRGLMAQGMGWKRIAAAAGISSGAMTKLLYGDHRTGRKPSQRIRPAAAAALLAVTLELGDGTRTDAARAHQIVRGLVAAGWSQSQIAKRVGMNRANFGTFMQRAQATVGTVRTVVEVGEELCTRKPPAGTRHERVAVARALNYAAARGWTVEELWDALDGEASTEPAEHRWDEIKLERAMRGDRTVRLTKVERAEAIRRLNERGMSAREAGERLGIAARTIQRHRGVAS